MIGAENGRLRGRAQAQGLSVALLTALAVACGPGEEAPSPTPPAAPAASPPPAPAPAPAAPDPAQGATAAQREAGVIFSTRCTTCHGPSGQGDGPGAAPLEPKPRNFHDPAWQSSVSDEHLRRIIVEGGGAVGKSPLMPPNPDLAGKPDVVAALVAQIRGFGKR